MSKELIEQLRNLAEVFGGKCAEDCTEAADRIEDLERLIEEQDELLQELRPIVVSASDVRKERDEWKARAEFSYRQRDELSRLCEFNEKTMSALQADNARLRDALEDSYMTNPCDTHSQQAAFDKAQSALFATHEQSLAEYRNKVIEAFVNEFSRHVGGDGEFWLHELQDFAMKEQP